MDQSLPRAEGEPRAIPPTTARTETIFFFLGDQVGVDRSGALGRGREGRRD